MTDNEFLEAVLLKHFFHIENEKTEMLDEEDDEEEMNESI